MSNPPARRRQRYQRGPHIFPRRGRGGAVTWYAYLRERPGGLSLKTADRAEAERRFRDLLAGTLSTHDVEQPAKERPLLEIAESYLSHPRGWTRETERTNRNLVAAFGEWTQARGLVYPSELTPDVITAWFNERQRQVSRRTINRCWRAARRMVAWASADEQRLCAPNAAVAKRAYFKEPDSDERHVVPDPDEMRGVLRELARTTPGAHLAVAVIYATGVRIAELQRLTPADSFDGAVHVRPEKGTAYDAEPTKGYRARDIPVTPEVQRLIAAFHAWRQAKGAKCSEAWLLRKLHAACEGAKVEPCGLHDIRRAFATVAVRSGVDLVVVSRWLGHKRLATTERYIATYRSDARIKAPVSTGLCDVLAGADGFSTVLKNGVNLSPSQSTRSVVRREKPVSNQRRGSDSNRRMEVLQDSNIVWKDLRKRR